jgi:hypothetical protein
MSLNTMFPILNWGRNLIQVFHNPLYDINETVGSNIDLMLGAVFGQIISHSNWLYYVRGVPQPTPEQYIKINYRLFSKAPEFRTKILEIVISMYSSRSVI